jgi:predicted  nucleic acid-binding Zn-ribbon protein
VDIDFKKLIQLQKLDTEINDASLFLENVPSQIEILEQKIKDSEKIVTTAQEKFTQNQKKRQDLEYEVQDLKEKVSKYKRQLNDVKTNIEYSSLLKEIGDSQNKIDHIEENIIAEMLLADDIEEEINTASQKAGEIKQKISQEIDELAGKQKNMEETKNALLEKRELLLPEIPAEILKLYDKISTKNSGIVLSLVTDEFCSMCYMRVRPQMLNELKTENEIILCENCGRILYLEKDQERPS